MSEMMEPIAEEPIAKALPVEVVAELEKVGIAATTDAELVQLKDDAAAKATAEAQAAQLAASLAAKQAELEAVLFTPEQLAVRARREEVTRFYAWAMNVHLIGDADPGTLEEMLATWHGGG